MPDSVVALFMQHGPLIFLILLFLTSFGLPLAKSLIVVTAGMLAAREHADTAVLFLGCAFGLHLGDFGVFLLGRGLGKDGLRRRPLSKILRARHVDRAEAFITRHGTASLLTARVTPFIRGPVYFLLGALKMCPIRFTAVNLATSGLYTLVFFLVGYHTANHQEQLTTLIRNGNTVLLGALVLVAALLFHKRRRQAALGR